MYIFAKVAKAKEAMARKTRSRSIGRQAPKASGTSNRPMTAPSSRQEQPVDNRHAEDDLVVAAVGSAHEAAVRAKLLMSFQQRDLKNLKEKVRKANTVSGYPRKTSAAMTAVNEAQRPTLSFGGRSTVQDQTKSFEAKIRGERSRGSAGKLQVRPMLIENVEKLATPLWRMQ